jgi:hypothetical protein
MIFLWVFGNAVNAKIGHWPYAGLYILFAVVAGAAWYAIPGNGLAMIGASGAIMGVAGMFAVLYPLNDISMLFVLLYRPIFFTVSAVWLLLVYFALNILGFLTPGGVVANISHLSGMVLGAAVAGTLLHTAVVKPGVGERSLLEILGVKIEREPGSEPKPYVKPKVEQSMLTKPEESEQALRRRVAAEVESIELAPPREDGEEPIDLAAPDEEEKPPPIKLEE